MSKILIIDNHESSLVSLQALICDNFKDFSVYTAANGQDGMQNAGEYFPDIIVLGNLRSGMVSFEVCKKLKDDKGLCDIPVVFVIAAQDGTEYKAQALQAGAEGFLSKPIDENELIAQVKAMLTIKAARDYKNNEKEQLKKLLDARTKELQEALRLSQERTKELGLSEAQYHAYIEYAPDGIFIFDEKGKCSDVNPAACQLTGYSEDELLKKSIPEILYDENIEAVLKRFNRLDVKGFYHADIRFTTKDGEPRIGELAAAKLPETRILGFLKDITERKQAEARQKDYYFWLELAMQSANMAWWEMDITTGLVTFEKRKTEMLGYAPEGFNHYKDFMALVHPEDTEKAMDAMRKHLDGSLNKYEVEYRILTNSGEYKWFYDIGSIVNRDLKGNPLNVCGLVMDITEHKKSDFMLAESETRYRSLFEDSNALMLIVDPENLAITDANKAAVYYYGWPQEELIGKNISLINTLPLVQLKEKMRLAINSDMNRFQFKHRHADGSISDVETHSSPIVINGKTYLFSIIHDISLQIQAQRERDAFSGKLSHYLATSPTITYAYRLQGGDIHMQWISENIAAILGYSTQEASIDGWWFNNLASEDRLKALQGIAELTRLGHCSQEYRFLKKDRTTAWIRDEMRLASANGGEDEEVVGTLTDISERKRSEAETTIKSAALEAAGNAIVITDRDGTIEWVNVAFTALSGYSKEEAIGKNSRDLVKSGAQDPELYRKLWDTLASGKSWQGELINKKKSGVLYDEEMLITPIVDESGNIAHLVAVKDDITERNRSRKLLEASVREKEMLLREVHHRVKNNMQIITSLLNLSEEGLPDDASSHVIGELHRRIVAMAIVHEQFYKAKDLTRIDFSVYLSELASSIVEDMGATLGNPEICYELQPLFLNLEAAIPAGLIVSELVSNAVKFSLARPDGKGSIAISLRVNPGNAAELEIRDNGPGFPEGFNAASATTLGLRLIQILSEQLKGTVSLRNDGGAVAVLRFHAPA